MAERAYSRHDPHGLLSAGRPEGVTADTFAQALQYLMEDDDMKRDTSEVGFRFFSGNFSLSTDLLVFMQEDAEIEQLINLLLALEAENERLRAGMFTYHFFF